MNNSLFLQYIEKYFRLVVGKISEKFNGKSTEPTLMHKTMLTEEYSPDLTWGATELNHSIVAADVVSLDSSLPLKSRSVLSVASGKLPKLGVKMSKGEQLITNVNIMAARGADEATIAAKVLDDVPKVVKSVDVRTEIMFQQGLSTGQCLVDADTNNGTGIRADFGYKDENKFSCTESAWGNADAMPQDDIQQLFDKAQEDSNSIEHVWISKQYFDLFRKSKQGKMIAAAYANMVVTDPALLPVPGRAAFLEALADEYGATFHIVDGAFKVENPDGSFTAVHPWAAANIVGTASDTVGRLVYGTLAEETNPVANVSYQKSGSSILVSKYSKTDPLEEFTAAQSLRIPVIDDGGSIYVLQADKVALLVDGTELAFPKSASNRTVNVQADGEVSVSSSEDWLTVSYADGVVSASATANTGDARTAVITITSNGKSVEVVAKQAANA